MSIIRKTTSEIIGHIVIMLKFKYSLQDHRLKINNISDQCEYSMKKKRKGMKDHPSDECGE